MYNPDPHNKNNHHHHHHLVSPRISFSNDFVESQYTAKQERRAAGEAPASSDFEFSVSSYSMMSADELFSKGKLLPFKEKATSAAKGTTTLREELLADDEDRGAGVSFRPPKGPGRWKGFLGLRKSHIGSKKADKSCEASCDSKRAAGFGQVPDNMHYHGKSSQEMMREGGSNSCRDEEMEM